jgi:hypothetical protein
MMSIGRRFKIYHFLIRIECVKTVEAVGDTNFIGDTNRGTILRGYKIGNLGIHSINLQIVMAIFIRRVTKIRKAIY